VVTYSGCSIDTVGSGYTLTASDSEKNCGHQHPVDFGNKFASFKIFVGSASQLVFSTQPVGGVGEATGFGTEPQ